jgi:endonuclease/exonuclease/phosphatase family metal-dependent hydrolase
MPHSQRPIRIVSYNVRYFGHALRGLASSAISKRRIAERLAALDPLPDVICLQEVETISMRSTVAHRRVHEEETQLESFMARFEDVFTREVMPFPYEALYFRAHTFGVANLPVYTTGLAMLVNVRRFRIDGHNAASPQAITHHHVARFKDRKQSRICAHARLVDERDHAVHVFNTHLSLPTPFAKEFWVEPAKMGFGRNQLAEARTLTSFVRERSSQEPFVVCGDFNTAPFSPVFQFLTEEAGLVCPELRAGLLDVKNPRSFPTAGFMHMRMHLDHFFHGAGVRWCDLEGCRRFGDRDNPFYGLSDHVPLVGRFALAA